MKAGTILIMTLMISAAICQNETDQQERGVVTDGARLGIGVVFGIVFGVFFGVIFVVCIFVSICCRYIVGC